MQTLSPAATAVLESYLALPFKKGGVVCPYYNNDKIKLHGGLRALVGKGSPTDIMDEALIISLHDKMNLDNLSPEEAKKFLVDHKIGVDCSALVYHTLDAEIKSKGRGSLSKYLKFPLVKNPFRKLLCKLRPAENTNVLSLAHSANSVPVTFDQLKPGDLIIFKNTGPGHRLQHVLLVHGVERENDKVKTVHYTHSFAWSKEGKYGNGVRKGTIDGPTQEWTEKGMVGEDNETKQHAAMADEVDYRRLRILA